jgi:hypothetical protein
MYVGVVSTWDPRKRTILRFLVRMHSVFAQQAKRCEFLRKISVHRSPSAGEDLMMLLNEFPLFVSFPITVSRRTLITDDVTGGKRKDKPEIYDVDKIDRYVTTTPENRCRFISYCSDRRIDHCGRVRPSTQVSPDDALLMDQSAPRQHLTYGTKSRETIPYLWSLVSWDNSLLGNWGVAFFRAGARGRQPHHEKKMNGSHPSLHSPGCRNKQQAELVPKNSTNIILYCITDTE